MSINEELSFTEYTLTEDTTDFIISFDRIGGSTDEVSILVNNTPIEDLVGYTVLQANFSTWQVEPALPAGTVVRLARTTNLDKMVYVFTAGSKFIAKNVDDNFKQIQHSQQEIRDRQDKLERDATTLLLEINDVKVIAEQAAENANEALERVDEILNTGVVPAGMILTNSGQTQQQVNDFGGAKWYAKADGYDLGAEVRLESGDRVRSTVTGNTNNPNTDMTGWKKIELDSINVQYDTIKQEQFNDGLASVDDMLAIPTPKNGMRVQTNSYIANNNKGGATYIYDASKSSINDGAVCINGWVLQGSKLDPYLCGAVGDGVTNDTIAMQRWLDLTESYKFGEAYLAAGSFLYTSTLNIGNTTSIKGVGQQSILRPTACHGLNFLASDAVGARYIKDFWIFGNDGFSHYGINCDLVSPAQRISGVNFSNVYISWMLGIANLRGVWHSEFTNIYGINNYRGVRFYGKNVKVDVSKSYIIRGNSINTGDAGTQYGVSIEQDELNDRSEDVKISRSLIFGYDRGVNVHNVLNGGVENCDIDFSRQFGIYVTLGDGGFSIKDNWIALDENSTSSIYGIYFAVLNFEKNSNRAIKDNYIIHYGSAPFGSSAGIYIGSNQNMISIHGNSVENFTYGIHVDYADYTSIVGNSLNTVSDSVLLVDTNGTTLDGNLGNHPIYCQPFSVRNTKFGQNHGAINTGLSGVGIIPVGQTSVAISFDSPIYVGNPSNLLPIVKVFGAINITYAYNYSAGNVTGVVFSMPATSTSVTQFAYEVAVYNRVS